MRQLDLISHSRADIKKPLRLRGFVSSAVFHTLLIAFVLELSFHSHWQLPLLHLGAVTGTPVVSLETMEVVAPPAPPMPPSPSLSALAFHVGLRSIPLEPLTAARPTVGLPLLPGNPVMTMASISLKTGAPIQHETVVASSGGGIAHLRPTTDKFVSYEYGLSDLPHPPYPTFARDLRKTGVVHMLVQFDNAGNVAQADVAKSSGVAILDSETTTFIRDNWHSTTYAGRSISVPVEYTLTSL